MIEGDINERMAQFAPSQNMDPALDVIRQRRGLLPPSTVAPSVAEMPEVAPQDGPDPIVDMLLERRKDRLNATLYGAMRVDPDQAARAQKLAPDVGVGPDMVMRHLPDMERQAKIADIERRRLYMNDPVLSNFLEQKEFAEVAHDDVGTLSKVKGIIGGIAAIPQSVSEGFRRGIATYELAGLLDKQRQRGGSVDVIEQAAIDSINEEIAALGKESGFWESATNIVTLNLAQAPEYVEPIVTGGVAGGAAGAALGLGGGPLAPATVPVGMATGIGLGLKAGAVTGAFEASRRLETALLYGQAREEGLDHDAANKVALAGGAVSGLLELVGVGIAGKAYSLAVKQVIRRSMNEALKNRTKRAVLKEAGLLYVGGGLGETATEVAQEIVNQTAIEAGKFMRDKPMIFNDPEEMQAFGDRLVDTAIETAKGMALIGLPGAGVQIYTGTRRAAKAERQQEVIQSLVENRKESKYANRDPQGYERFLAAQSEGTPAETIYIDGTVAQQVLAQSGVTVAELEQVIPGIRQRIVDAVATGGDVTIPTAQFGARLANTDLGTAMLPHVRLSPDAMSITEVQEFNARRQEERRSADEALQAAEAVRDTFVAEAQAVRDWARDQAIAAGQDADAADVAASMYQAFVVTQAAEQNMTPAQFQAAQGVRGIQGIIGEMAPAAAAASEPQPEGLIRLYRGEGPITVSKADETAGTFWTPERKLAAAYGEQGSLRQIDFVPSNLLEAPRWSDIKAKLQLPASATVPDVIEAAKNRGHDSIAFMGPQGKEYILLNKVPTEVRDAAGRIPVKPKMGLPVLQEGVPAAPVARAAPAVPEFVAPPKPEGMDQKFYDDLIQRAIREVGGSPTVEVTRGNQVEGATTGIPRQTEANLRAAGNDAAADVYIAAAQQAADRNVAAFQARRAAAAAPGVMEQAAQFLPSGERRTDTPEFKAWSNNAQVIESERSEAHEFTTGKPVVVEALHGSTERGLRRFDVGRAVEVPGAIFFTSNPAVAEQYTYERAYGDIISDQPTGDVIRAYVAFANPMVYQPKGKVVDAIEMGRAIEQAKAAGHDGIIIKNIDDSIGMTGDMGDVYVTWNPTSIKSVDNRGTWSRETANIFEQAGTQPRLMAVHNLSADNLVFADRMGGLSVPSIGVITEERGGVEGFGEITLIGTREMADPYLSRVFESDAYSARFPQPEWPKVSVAKADKFVAQLRDVAQRYDERGIIAVTFDQMVNNPNANKVAEAWLRSPAVMALFLGEKGIDVAPIMRERKSNTVLDWPAIEALRPLYEAVNQDQAYSDVEASPEFIALREAFGNAVRQKYAGVELPEGWLERWAADFSGTMLSNLGRDLRQPETQRVDSSATRDAMDAALDPFKAEYKSWVDTKVRSQFGEPFLRVGRARKPYTLPNIVDVMTSAKVKGEEKGMTFGVGATRAEVAKEFMDLEQMREAAKSAIIDPEEYGKVNKETNALLEAYRNAAIEYTTLTDWRGQTDTWAALDGSMRALANYGKRKRKDAGTMRAALAREGFAVEKMPPALITQAIEAANALFTAPVPYFEAKPQRAVRLGEFAGAVIPSNVDQEVRDILDRNGLAYMTYIAGDEADRQRAVREMGRSPEARGEVLFQAAAAPGPRGGFDVRRMMVMLTKASDRTTLWHEFVHFFLHMYTEAAVSGRASERQLNDLDLLLKWFKIDGETPAERLAKWSAMTLDQKRKHHEALTYNAEIYAFEGKAPSAELIPVFERLRAFMLRVYKSIRDDLNAIYRREFGEDLPILTGEVREVMDRMLATDEQIRRQAAINEMKPIFQSQEQSGMNDAEWTAYQAMQQEAIEAAVTDMNKASLRQMQWLGNARSRILKDIQRKHDRQRKEVAVEVAAAVRVEPVYRAMTYLRTGRFIDADGTEVEVEGPHRLDTKRVKAIYETVPTVESLEPLRATGMPLPTVVQPNLAKLGTGSGGMMGLDGLDPDLVAETFGFSSGDQLIRALVAARPIKEEVAARTDAEMLRRFGDMNTPEAVEAEVQAALHNEARARFVAVELRYVARATEPVRVMLDAAKQVARDLIAGKRVRDVRPSDFVAAEARAARDATRIGAPTNPVAIGQAAQTRTYNDAIEAGTDPAEAMVAAIEAGAEAARIAQERADALRAQYGAEPQQALIRAKRAQLYQNQLAAEALRVQEEVAKAVKYLRRVLRDENVKRMGAAAADQIAGLLERYEVAPVSLKRLDERRALAEWLAAQEAAGLVPDIAPEIANEARRINYREVKVSEFRDLVDAVKQIEFIGKNERKLQLAEERAAFEETRDEIVTRIRAVAKVRGLDVDPRSPLTNIGRTAAALRGFAAQHLKAASVARILDGGKDDGPLWNAIIRTANTAADMETTMRAEASAKLAEILGPVFKLGNMGGKGIYFPSIDRALNREARIAIALNVGNDGNRQRLLDGEGWTMEQIQPVLESLTEAEWQAVQQVWDYIDTYRPLIAEKERRLYGKTPEWVEAVPMTVRTADGKVVNLTGGYYPIKYDPVASDRVATIDEVADAKRAMDGAYTAATTRRSFVKARAKEVVDRPLLYTLDAAFSGVNDVIHDLAWHEWLIGTNRLLRDTEFANAVRETRGPEFLKQLRDWAKDNAAGERKQQVAGEGALSWLRQGISASGLGFNIVSAIMQVTGFNQSIVRVGAKYVGRGIAQFAGAPIATARMVADKSQFMAERGRTQFRELNEIRNRVRGQTEVARRVTAGTYFLMMNMQRTVDVPTWLGAYQKALDAGKDDARAVALADQAVRDSQGSGLISDLAAIERGGPMMKLFTVFYSYMNTVYNMTAVQTYTARGRGKLAADYVMLLVVPVVLGQAIKNLVQPDADDDELDPEELARKLAAEELSFIMGTMVIAREFGGAAQLLTGAEGVRMGYGGPAGLRAVGEVYGLATQAGQLEFDRAFRRSAINTLGAFTGLPSAQINRTIDGIEAVVEGEVTGVGAVAAPFTGVQR